MSTISEFSTKELMAEISARATKADVAIGLGNIGLFTLERGVSSTDLDKLAACNGVSTGDDEAYIYPQDFEDWHDEISPELLDKIAKAKEFGIELIQAYR